MGIHLRIGVFLWVLLLQGGIAIAAETAKEIERLLDAGSAGEAYDLGLTRSAEEAGDPEFDFWFALAAMRVGHPEQALFALERILLLFPDNDRVRLELARAHFMLGNYPEARTQFEIVLTHRPPANVRERVKLFLEKIREQERTVRPSYYAYADISTGHDTNINSATSDVAVDVPALGIVALDPLSQELDDNFVELEVGGEALRPISRKKVLFGRISASLRDNVDTDEFDTDILGLRGGMSFLRKRSVIRIPLQFEQLNLDGERFRRFLIAGLEWERPLIRANWLTVFGQLGAIEYPEEEFRDVDLALIGTAWTHRFPVTNNQLNVGIYFGDEEADEDEPFVFKEHNGRDYVGLYGRYQWNLKPKHTINLNGALQSIEHAVRHPTFGQVREEDLIQLTVDWNWRWRPKWTINIGLSYYNNDSNLELFSYDRTLLRAGVRYGLY